MSTSEPAKTSTSERTAYISLLGKWFQTISLLKSSTISTDHFEEEMKDLSVRMSEMSVDLEIAQIVSKTCHSPALANRIKEIKLRYDDLMCDSREVHRCLSISLDEHRKYTEEFGLIRPLVVEFISSNQPPIDLCDDVDFIKLVIDLTCYFDVELANVLIEYHNLLHILKNGEQCQRCIIQAV
jgi:hypothetical protein